MDIFEENLIDKLAENYYPYENTSLFATEDRENKEALREAFKQGFIEALKNVIEIFPSSIHNVMAGSNFPVYLRKVNNDYIVIDTPYRNPTEKEIKEIKELYNNNKLTNI